MLSASAQNLPFPVERNNVQVFPQRFEYQLLDKDRIQIGDIIVDASKLDFQLIPVAAQQLKFRMKFRWPAGLFQEGELVIKDNIGKALWLQTVDKKQIQKSSKDLKEDRNQLAFFESEVIDANDFKKLEFTAFFKFCINKSEGETKIYFCSKDLYLKKDGTQVSVQSRDSFRKESYVEINGRSVDPQGQIFLNEITDTISMRTLLLSGATLEINTRKKIVQFYDIVMSESNKNLIIRARGAEPVEGYTVKKKNDSDWETELTLDRPVLYLQGEGGIPLRQEFLLKGSIRHDNIQVTVTEGWKDPTYLSTAKLKLKKSFQEGRLSPLEKNSRFDAASNWSLENLEKGKINRRHLLVDVGNERYQAMFETYRGYSDEVSTRLMLPLWSQTQAEHWFDDMRWGFGAQYEKLLSKASDEIDWSALGVSALFRFKPGLHMKDPTWGAAVKLESSQMGSTLTVLSVELFGLTQPTVNWAWWTWLNYKLKLPLMAMGPSDIKMKTSYDLELSFRNPWHNDYFFDYGIRHANYAFEASPSGVTAKTTRTMGFVGVGLIF